MRVPMNIENTFNVYLAFRAILIEVIKFNSDVENINANQKIQHVVCPGLGTGIGCVPAEICAKQMFKAYNVIVHPEPYLDLARQSCETIGMNELDSEICAKQMVTAFNAINRSELNESNESSVTIELDKPDSNISEPTDLIVDSNMRPITETLNNSKQYFFD